MKIFLYIVALIIFFIILYTVKLCSDKKINGNYDNDNEYFIDCKNSFCILNQDTNKCECKNQKDDLRYIFDSPSNCCDNECSKIPPDQCHEDNPFYQASYYCNMGGECKKYDGTIRSSHISANYCGNDPLNNQLLLPYASLEECSKSIEPCDKYNVVGGSSHVNRSECLKDVNCGWCSNKSGGGKCISGTASGPNDLNKYFYCTPGDVSGHNSYEYGNHAAYLLQK